MCARGSAALMQLVLTEYPRAQMQSCAFPQSKQHLCAGTAQDAEQHQRVKPLSVDRHTSYTHAD